MATPRAAPPPGPRRRVPRRLQIALLVVAVVAAAVALAGQLLHRSAASSRTFPAVRAVELTADAGTVSIVATRRRDVHVATTLTWSLRAPTQRMGLNGEVLRLSSSCPGGLGSGRCSVGWQLQLPAAIDLHVLLDSGDVFVRGTTGAVVVRTEAGRMDVIDVGGSRLDVSSGAGNVVVTTRRPPDILLARSDGGDVRVGVPIADYRVSARSSTGAVRVEVPSDPSSSRSVTAYTDAGEIVVAPTPRG